MPMPRETIPIQGGRDMTHPSALLRLNSGWSMPSHARANKLGCAPPNHHSKLRHDTRDAHPAHTSLQPFMAAWTDNTG
jgi:hypothetical protein